MGTAPALAGRLEGIFLASLTALEAYVAELRNAQGAP